eukprot:6052027-Pyramimonas_sp.AAC.1
MLAFGREAENAVFEAAPDVDVGAESFSQQMGRKVKKATEGLFKNQSRLAYVVTLALATQPVDELVLLLIQRDEQGRILADLHSDKLCPVRACQRSLCTSLRHRLAPPI